MKNLLYVFIAVATLISCGSDNDTVLDPIIGTWQLESNLEDGIEVATECERQTTVIFLENGTTTTQDFYDEGNGCENETETSDWLNRGNSRYSVDNNTESFKINFSENNTIFSFTMSEVDDGITRTATATYKKI